FEILRRSDDVRAHRRADAHGHHVLFDQLAEADAGVVSLRNDIDQQVLDPHLDVDVRVLVHEAAQHRLQHDQISGTRYVDAQLAGRMLGLAADLRGGANQLFYCRLDQLQVTLAILREADAAGGAVEERPSEPLLQGTNGLAHRRGRNTELHARGSEALCLGYRDEGDQPVQLVLAHVLLRSRGASHGLFSPT